MARPAKLLQTFEEELDRSVALLDAVRELRFPPSAGRRFPALPNFQLALIAELSFLRCFLSWEVFLEEVFMAYAMGEASRDGSEFLCYMAAPDPAHARDMVKGEGRAFVPWADPSGVLKRARRFFNGGEPFETALSMISTPLNDMVVVRNRVAHRSGRAADRFLELVRRQHGAGARGMSAGRFLLAPGTNPNQRRIDEYVFLLRAAGVMIVP
jgi:hypothetical protein